MVVAVYSLPILVFLYTLGFWGTTSEIHCVLHDPDHGCDISRVCRVANVDIQK